MSKGKRGWNLTGPNKPVVRGKDHHFWKGDDALRQTKRRRAQRIYALGPCEHCGKPGVERHHKDDDTGNNKPSNIVILCRACHMIEDGRMFGFMASSLSVIGPRPPKPCVNCGRESKPLRYGRCRTCSEYFRRRGIERPYVVDGRKEKAIATHAAPCIRCARPAGCVGKPSRGYCASCYTVLYRKGELPWQV